MDLERILIIQPVERIVKFEPRITVKSSDRFNQKLDESSSTRVRYSG
jgi:hypothetical protein